MGSFWGCFEDVERMGNPRGCTGVWGPFGDLLGTRLPQGCAVVWGPFGDRTPLGGMAIFWGPFGDGAPWGLMEVWGPFWESFGGCDKDGAPLGVHRSLGTFWGTFWGPFGDRTPPGAHSTLGTFWRQGTPWGHTAFWGLFGDVTRTGHPWGRRAIWEPFGDAPRAPGSPCSPATRTVSVAFSRLLPRAATCPLSPAENLHPQHNQQEDQGRVSGIVSISLPSPAPFGVPNVPGEGATVPRGGL